MARPSKPKPKTVTVDLVDKIGGHELFILKVGNWGRKDKPSYPYVPFELVIDTEKLADFTDKARRSPRSKTVLGNGLITVRMPPTEDGLAELVALAGAKSKEKTS